MGQNLMDRIQAKYAADNYYNGMSVQQLMADAALIALHREFGFGADRSHRFIEALHTAVMDMSDAITDDTDDCIYSKQKIDDLLQSFLSKEDFASWDERYAAAINPYRGNREQRRARKQKQKRR